MKYALDTNIVIRYVRVDPVVGTRVENALAQGVCIPQVVDYEIRRGLSVVKVPSIKRERLYSYLRKQCPLVALKTSTWEIAIQVYKTLRQKGFTIGEMDILIAAICLENDLILVTNNTKDFSNIDGLRLENWTQHQN